MRIAIVANSLPPKIGGIEAVTNDICEYFAKLGHEVSVFISEPCENERDLSQFEIISIDSHLFLGRLPLPLISVTNLATLKEVRKTSFDLLIVQSHLFIINWIFAILLRQRSRIVWITHGGAPVKSSSKILNILISFYEEIGLRLLVFCSHSQFAQNGLAQKRLDKYFQQPVELLNNFIPTHFFESQSRSQLVSKVRKVLFVGRFVEDKGIRELFDLFESTQRRYLGNQIEFDITITFIGDGPLLPWAKKQSSNYNLNCRFLGALSRPEVLDEMRTHDLLVQYPRSEGQPLVLLEAISMGLPIFTTPVDDCLNSLDSVYVAKEEDFKDEFYKILQNGIGTHSDHLKEIRHLKEHHSIELYCRKIIELGLK